MASRGTVQRFFGKDILKRVKSSRFPKVLELLEKDWPDHIVMHQMITSMRVYKENKSVVKSRLYRYGEVDGGVYMVKTKFWLSYADDETNHKHTHIIIYTTSSDLSDLNKVLEKTSRIPWYRKFLMFENVVDEIMPLIEKVAEMKSCLLVKKRTNVMMVAPRNDLRVCRSPVEARLRPLYPRDAHKLNSVWPHKYSGSKDYIRIQVENDVAFGLFMRGNVRACSAITCYHGGICGPNTIQGHRSMGYTEFVVREMTQKLKENGRHPYVLYELKDPRTTIALLNIGYIRCGQVNVLQFRAQKYS